MLLISYRKPYDEREGAERPLIKTLAGLLQAPWWNINKRKNPSLVSFLRLNPNRLLHTDFYRGNLFDSTARIIDPEAPFW
jgi:hypothetical protein